MGLGPVDLKSTSIRHQYESSPYLVTSIGKFFDQRHEGDGHGLGEEWSEEENFSGLGCGSQTRDQENQRQHFTTATHLAKLYGLCQSFLSEKQIEPSF